MLICVLAAATLTGFQQRMASLKEPIKCMAKTGVAVEALQPFRSTRGTARVGAAVKATRTGSLRRATLDPELQSRAAEGV